MSIVYLPYLHNFQQSSYLLSSYYLPLANCFTTSSERSHRTLSSQHFCQWTPTKLLICSNSETEIMSLAGSLLWLKIDVPSCSSTFVIKSCSLSGTKWIPAKQKRQISIRELICKLCNDEKSQLLQNVLVDRTISLSRE